MKSGNQRSRDLQDWLKDSNTSQRQKGIIIQENQTMSQTMNQQKENLK